MILDREYQNIYCILCCLLEFHLLTVNPDAVLSYWAPTFLSTVYAFNVDLLSSTEKEEVKFREQVEKLKAKAGESWLTFYNELQVEETEQRTKVVASNFWCKNGSVVRAFHRFHKYQNIEKFTRFNLPGLS